MNENTAFGHHDRGPDVVPARAFVGCDTHRIKRAFYRPSGVLGRIAVWIMNRTNAPLYQAAVALLAPQPVESVLEIGFGSGNGLAALADRLGEAGMIAGIDPSEQMLGIATRRFQHRLSKGGMRLTGGTADDLPWPDQTFDAVLAVSSVQFWKPASQSFREVLRVLRAGGRLVLGVHTLAEGAAARHPGFYPDEVAGLMELLVAAGFAEVEKHTLDMGGNGLCVVARRPPERHQRGQRL